MDSRLPAGMETKIEDGALPVSDFAVGRADSGSKVREWGAGRIAYLLAGNVTLIAVASLPEQREPGHACHLGEGWASLALGPINVGPGAHRDPSLSASCSFFNSFRRAAPSRSISARRDPFRERTRFHLATGRRG